MILIAVIVGYILGIAPFVYKELIVKFENRVIKKEVRNYDDEMKQLLNEYLNGPQEDVNGQNNKVNQEDIFKEYITGNVSTKD